MKKIISKLNNFLNIYLFLEKLLLFSDSLGENTLEKYIKTLKIYIQSNRIDLIYELLIQLNLT